MRRHLPGLLTATLIGSIAVAGTLTDPIEAATPIAGFTDSSVASVSRPTTIEWLPGDRIVVLEQGGRVRVAHPGQPFNTALTIQSICTTGERGLLGLTPDPAFAGNGLVYVYYTRFSNSAPGGCVNRVSRFHMNGDIIDPASEVVLLDNISSVNSNHNGGDLDIGSDGNLYVGVGDAGRDPRGDSGSAGSNDAAQDLSLLNGKILRITLDGQPAPGNPLSGPGTARCAVRGNTPATPTSSCQELFAWGLRNPYRIAFDRNDGSNRFFINDVGQNTFEEVNQGLVGRNYGWPEREGLCRQGQTPLCDAAPPGITDPITAYPRSQGTYITAGAFIPNGLWPATYDGAYLFSDGGSGRIWIRDSNGSIDYGTPFATGAFGITDMTFGFDAAGRSVLYYVQSGGSVRAINSTAPLVSSTASGLKTIPITPIRAYDTIDNTGGPPGVVFNGTTRRVDLDPPAGAEAALVNLTYASTSGPGFIRAWGTRAARPTTSSVNADRAGSVVANAAVVPLDPNGSFVLESSTTGRVVVDVMGWLTDSGGSSDDGRLIALDPARLVDTRIASGTTLASGSPNPWTRAGARIDFTALGHLDLPDDGTAAAIVISIGAISGGGPGGYVGGFPGGSTWGGTSNVNVVSGDVRANVMMIPTDSSGLAALQTLNIADVVIDVLGYITSDAAVDSGSGLYSSIDPVRVVDTRIPLGFDRLTPLSAETVTIPGGASSAAVVQNITVTDTSAAGWVVAHPTAFAPVVSNVNYTGPGQTRAALAFTRLTGSGQERFTSLVDTELVVDVVGFFSE